MQGKGAGGAWHVLQRMGSSWSKRHHWYEHIGCSIGGRCYRRGCQVILDATSTFVVIPSCKSHSTRGTEQNVLMGGRNLDSSSGA